MNEIEAMKKTLHFAGYEVLKKDEFVSLQVRIADAAQRVLHDKMACGHERFFLREDEDEWWCLRCVEVSEVNELRAEVDRLRAEIQGYKDHPGKLFVDCHEVEEYYRPDPCEAGHLFTWTSNCTISPWELPSELRCERCGKSYAQLFSRQRPLDLTGE